MTHVVEGDLIDPAELRVDGAQQVWEAAGWYPLATPVEARTREIEKRRVEVLVIDIEPELPQDLAYDIGAVERLSLSFLEGERDAPVVVALREDFPHVPHLNSTAASEPKSLCVYDDPWSEVRLRWTGVAFLRHLVQWLSRTAVGELHGADQPLEPFLFESVNAVVFPEQVFEDGTKAFAAQAVQEQPGWPFTLKLREVDEGDGAASSRFYCVALAAEPAPQEAMRDSPRNLNELASILADVGVDLWEELRSRVRMWYSGTHRPDPDDGVVVLVRLPRLREASGVAESNQYLAFELHPIQELAMASGLVGSAGAGGELLPLASGDVDRGLAGLINVVPMRAVRSLDRAGARCVSGLDTPDKEPRVVLVGVGALGSQIHNNLSRMGWGLWTVVDKDTLLPHNVTRHRLGEDFVGWTKVMAVAGASCIETPHNAVEGALLTDANAGEMDELLSSTYAEADLILDASTSVAVARSLGRLDTGARCASLFVNPNGRDAVMLMEDAGRMVTLDALEAQYYRAVLSDERLAEHIGEDPRIRYGAGCRDLTARACCRRPGNG